MNRTKTQEEYLDRYRIEKETLFFYSNITGKKVKCFSTYFDFGHRKLKGEEYRLRYTSPDFRIYVYDDIVEVDAADLSYPVEFFISRLLSDEFYQYSDMLMYDDLISLLKIANLVEPKKALTISDQTFTYKDIAKFVDFYLESINIVQEEPYCKLHNDY